MLGVKNEQNQNVARWNIDDTVAYSDWRRDKLDNYSRLLSAPPVVIKSLSCLAESERTQLAERCEKANLAIYQTAAHERQPTDLRRDLRAFSDALGLRIAERHRSAGHHGIVALQITNAQAQRGYIPYTKRPINWHTDGYYNGPEDQIRAMVLHCVRPAKTGGINQFLDPEIAYIRLRDLNPAYITTLMHPQAMSIPENREPDGRLRPISVGPVFLIDQDSHLAMRYTARSRSILWRKDATTRHAVAALQGILTSDDPLIQSAGLKAGQGILCNNVLHNRTGFDSNATKISDRLLFRIRFHNRIKETQAWQN